MSDSSANEPKVIPPLKAITVLCNRFLDDCNATFWLSITAEQGLRMVASNPPLVRALGNVHKLLGEPDRPEQIENAIAAAERAQKEIDAGFPRLRAQSVVAIWSRLEAYVKDVIVLAFRDRPAWADLSILTQLRPKSIAEYEGIEPDDRPLYFLQLLDRDIKTDSKDGFGRLQELLKTISLGPDIKNETRRDLMELNQVRNALIHWSGRIDHRFLQKCPWVARSVGDAVPLEVERLISYVTAVALYAKSIEQRVRDRSQSLDTRSTPAPPETNNA